MIMKPNKNKTKPGQGFMDKYKKSKEFSSSMAKRNMGVSFTTKDGEPVAFRMPPFPRNIPEGDAGAGLRALKAEAPEAVEKMGFTRYMESEDGMLKREELKPLNKMGTVPLQRNEMPMAYKHKAYKSTGSAKAIPFTAK